MTAIVTPKFPPTWETWGDTCCCEAIMSQQTICCNGNFYFISKFGNVGVLFNGEQEIKTIGFTEKYTGNICCGNYIYLGTGGTLTGRSTGIFFYKDQLVFKGKVYVPRCCPPDMLGFSDDNDPLLHIWLFYKGKRFPFNILNILEDYHEFCSVGGYALKINMLAETGRRDMELFYKETRIYYGLINYWRNSTTSHSGYMSFSNHFAVMEYGTGKTFVFYHDKLIYYDKYLTITGSPQNILMVASVDHFCIDGQDSNGNPTVKCFYRDEEVSTVVINASTWSTVFILNDFVLMKGAQDSTTLVTRYVLIYKDEVIEEAEHLGLISHNSSRQDTYYFQIVANGSPARNIVYYQNQKVFDDIEHNVSIGSKHYSTIRKSDGYFEIFFGAQKIDEGIITVTKNYFGSNTNSDYVVYQKTDDMRALLYKNEKIYEGTITSFGSSGGYFFVINSKMAKGFYNGVQIYDGAVVGTYSQSVFYCNDFVRIYVSTTHTIIFDKGINVYESVSARKAFLCCGNRLYLTYNENNTPMIDVLDTDFGRMKFDLDTFERLA